MDTVDYQEQESHSPVSHPGRTVASLPHDSWTFPSRQQKAEFNVPWEEAVAKRTNSMYFEMWLQQKEQIQCTLGGGCSVGSLVWEERRGGQAWCFHWESWNDMVFPLGAEWDGEQGTGPAPHPGLQVLSLLFCLNEAAALTVAHNLQPTADPQVPSPGCSGRNVLTHRSHLIPGESPPPWGMQRCCAPFQSTSGRPFSHNPTFKVKIQSVLSLSFFSWPHELTLPTLSKEGSRGRGAGWELAPGCHTGSGFSFY